MTKKWIGFIAGYAFIALLGMTVVLVATAYLRAVTVQSEIAKAEDRLAEGQPGAALGHLDRARKWARLYPGLEKERLLVSIRCHIQRMDIPRASDNADAVMELVTSDRAHGFLSMIDFMVGKLVSIAALQTAEENPLAAWDGYVTMMHELRLHGQAALLPSVAESIASRFPESRLPPPVQAALQERLTRSVHTASATAATPAPGVTTGGDGPSPGATDGSAYEPADVTSSSPPVPDVLTPTNVAAPQKPPDTGAAQGDGPPGWAITIRDGVRAYDLSGTLHETLEIGSAIEITDVRDSSAGEVAIGRLAGTTGPSIAIQLKDLERYREAYGDVPVATRELLVRRTCLLAEVAELRKRLTEEAIAAGNPHAQTYRAAKEAYVVFWKRAKEAQAQMEASTGAEHMEHADTLRKMKLEEVPIRQAYDSSKKANDAWMAANGDRIEAAASPELERLEAELIQVEQALKGL